MKTLYLKKDAATAEIYERNNYSIITCSTLLNPDAYKECCDLYLDKVKRGIKTLILNAQDSAGIPSDEICKWMINQFIPELKRAGLRLFIIVTPKEHLAKMKYYEWFGNESDSKLILEATNMYQAILLSKFINK
jgi:hypothetical protein